MTPPRIRHRTRDHRAGQTAVLTHPVPICQWPLFCPVESRATPLCDSSLVLLSCTRRFRSSSKHDTTVHRIGQ